MSLDDRSQAGFFNKKSKLLIISQLCTPAQDNEITRKLFFCILVNH